MFGPLPLLVLAILVALVTGIGALVAIAEGVLRAILGETGAMFGAVSLGVVSLVAIELTSRARRSERSPLWLVDLDDAAQSRRVGRAEVGGKAFGLIRAQRIGLPIVGGVVVTQRLGELLVAVQGSGQTVFSNMPGPARRALRSYLRRLDGSVVVRSSFTSEEGAFSFAGVFESARAPASDLDAVAMAAVRVLKSSDGESAREYRRRHRHTAAMGRSLLLQEELNPDWLGIAASRGADGRADVVTIDFGRRRSPTRSVHYDFLTDSVQSVGQEGAAIEVAPWMRHVTVVAMLLEQELRGPVQVEFAVVDGCLRVLQVRRARPPERVTFTCQMPFDRGTERRPALLHDLRGGIENQRLGMKAALGRVGLSSDAADREIRYIDGAPYVDLEVIRRTFAELGRALLVKPSLRVLWGLLRPFPTMVLPPVIDTSDVSRQAWGGVKIWHETVLLSVARAHFEVATLGVLARMAHRLLRDSSSSQRRAHPALVRLLVRQRRRCDAEAERLEKFIQASEGAIADFARALLARGVEAWDQMFSGDRHLHLGLSMIDQWIEGDEQAKAALDAKWRERRAALAKREDRPAPARVHHPPLSTVPEVPDALRAVGLAPGEAQGLAAPIARNAAAATARGAIAVLSDGTSDGVRHALSAKGIVLTGGGTLSPVATVAAELNIPAVYCPGARPGLLSAGMPVSINGALGVIKVR